MPAPVGSMHLLLWPHGETQRPTPTVMPAKKPYRFSFYLFFIYNGRGQSREALDGEGDVISLPSFGQQAIMIAPLVFPRALFIMSWQLSVRQGC
jgi:hypothetical protein